MITDILKGGSELMIAGDDKEILSKAFNVNIDNDSVYIPGVVSRKKQVIPPISSIIANIK